MMGHYNNSPECLQTSVSHEAAEWVQRVKNVSHEDKNSCPDYINCPNRRGKKKKKKKETKAIMQANWFYCFSSGQNRFWGRNYIFLDCYMIMQQNMLLLWDKMLCGSVSKLYWPNFHQKDFNVV